MLCAPSEGEKQAHGSTWREQRKDCLEGSWLRRWRPPSNLPKLDGAALCQAPPQPWPPGQLFWLLKERPGLFGPLAMWPLTSRSASLLTAVSAEPAPLSFLTLSQFLLPRGLCTWRCLPMLSFVPSGPGGREGLSSHTLPGAWYLPGLRWQKPFALQRECGRRHALSLTRWWSVWKYAHSKFLFPVKV